MNPTKIKISVMRSFPITAGAFILSIVLFSVGSIIDGNLIDPLDILKIFAMFILIGVINFCRFYIDGSKWSMNKPSIVKNFIFAPIYLIIALFFAVWLFGAWDIGFIALMGGIFIAVFMIGQTISFFIAKATTDKMNDALLQFQKEHSDHEKE